MIHFRVTAMFQTRVDNSYIMSHLEGQNKSWGTHTPLHPPALKRNILKQEMTFGHEDFLCWKFLEWVINVSFRQVKNTELRFNLSRSKLGTATFWLWTRAHDFDLSVHLENIDNNIYLIGFLWRSNTTYCFRIVEAQSTACDADSINVDSPMIVSRRLSPSVRYW